MKIFWIGLAYFVGALPSGYLIFRLKEKKDIRSYGSQSIGATNVLRLKGWRYAAPVAIIDVLKSALPVWLALRAFPDERWVAYSVAFMVVLGHCFPIYIKFRGGKGVATALGAFAVLSTGTFFCSLAVFGVIVAATRYVSLGSLLATLSFPLIVLFRRGDAGLIYLGLAVFALVTFRHAGNLKRLAQGSERKIGQKISVEKP